jgi:small multidrug resistance pump
MLLAILLEVAGTILIKYSQGFTKPVPSVMVCLCYAGTFPLLVLALQKIPMNIAYPIWAGMGTFLVVLAGTVFFQEPVNTIKMVSAFLIIL